MRWIRKLDPSRRTREELLGELPQKKRTKKSIRLSALAGSRPSFAEMRGSRTDMATGVQSVHRGFDFSQEEGGIAIQRIQTNLSERRLKRISEGESESKGRRKRSGSRHFFSLGRSKKRSPSETLS